MTGQHRKPRKPKDFGVALVALFGLCLAAVLFIAAAVLIIGA